MGVEMLWLHLRPRLNSIYGRETVEISILRPIDKKYDVIVTKKTSCGRYESCDSLNAHKWIRQGVSRIGEIKTLLKTVVERLKKMLDIYIVVRYNITISRCDISQ